MDATANLRLPYMLPAQAQKHVTHNEAIRMLDAITQARVLDRNLTSPPLTPVEGDRYIIAESADGDWVSRDHALTAWQDGAWAYYEPQPGWLVWISDENLLVVWDGVSWITANAGGAVTETSLGDGSHSLVGVNGATADATNRLSVKTPSALFDSVDVAEGGTGDCRVMVNKEAAGDTASHMFQAGFSGRAEFGLTGDDNFHIKVSSNGAQWEEAFVIDKDNGNVAIGGPTGAEKLRLVGDNTVSSTVADFLLEKDAFAGFQDFSVAGDGQTWYAPFFQMKRARGTHASPSGVQDGDIIGGIPFTPYTPSGGYSSRARVQAVVNGIPSGASVPTDLIFSAGAIADNERMRIYSDGGVTIGSPAGGSKGAGVLNAESVYDDNTLLTCYIFDQALDSVVDLEKWDAKVPDRVVAAKMEVDKKTGDWFEIIPQKSIKRAHEPLRKFMARIGGEYDPLTLDGYAKHWKDKRHLTSMPNETTFDPENGMAAGEWIQRLVETVEIHAVLIEALNVRTKGNSGRGEKTFRAHKIGAT